MRETGPVRRGQEGDSDTYIGIARTQLGILKHIMALGGLAQLSRVIRFADGVTVFVASIFGQDTIRITRPPQSGGRPTVEAIALEPAAVEYLGWGFDNPGSGIRYGTVSWELRLVNYHGPRGVFSVPAGIPGTWDDGDMVIDLRNNVAIFMASVDFVGGPAGGYGTVGVVRNPRGRVWIGYRKDVDRGAHFSFSVDAITSLTFQNDELGANSMGGVAIAAGESSRRIVTRTTEQIFHNNENSFSIHRHDVTRVSNEDDTVTLDVNTQRIGVSIGLSATVFGPPILSHNIAPDGLLWRNTTVHVDRAMRYVSWGEYSRFVIGAMFHSETGPDGFPWDISTVTNRIRAAQCNVDNATQSYPLDLSFAGWRANFTNGARQLTDYLAVQAVRPDGDGTDWTFARHVVERTEAGSSFVTEAAVLVYRGTTLAYTEGESSFDDLNGGLGIETGLRREWTVKAITHRGVGVIAAELATHAHTFDQTLTFPLGGQSFKAYNSASSLTARKLMLFEGTEKVYEDALPLGLVVEVTQFNTDGNALLVHLGNTSGAVELAVVEKVGGVWQKFVVEADSTALVESLEVISVTFMGFPLTFDFVYTPAEVRQHISSQYVEEEGKLFAWVAQGSRPVDAPPDTPIFGVNAGGPGRMPDNYNALWTIAKQSTGEWRFVRDRVLGQFGLVTFVRPFNRPATYEL